MSWENELKPEIKLTSPDGNVFNAKWIGNERSFEKKLGIFSIPNFDGEIVQDMSVQSNRWPLTIYFDGFFHNKESNRFYESLRSEKGQWEIVHPVRGPLVLQLISCTENLQPVENGNYTVFDTQWIEPANITRLISQQELASQVLNDAVVAYEDLILQLQQTRTDLYAAIQRTKNMFQKVSGFYDTIVRELTATNALLFEDFEDSQTELSSAISNFGIDNTDVSDIADSMVDLAESPIDISENFNTRFAVYKELLETLYTLVPTMTTIEDLNAIIALEYCIVVAIVVIAKIVATSTFQSRPEVVSAIQNITDIFNNTVSTLETIQDLFATLDIDRQYYSFLKQYTILVNIYSNAIRFLITEFYNLQAEKRFTIKNARSPLEIAVTEYGELGEDDFYYDLFLTSNNLSGNDILLLPAGREVVIYV